jgi:hypothetical protein
METGAGGASYPGAELHEETVRQAQALPLEHRNADVRAFVEANARLMAAAEVLMPLARGEESSASAEQRLLAVLHYLVGAAGIGMPEALHRPRQLNCFPMLRGLLPALDPVPASIVEEREREPLRRLLSRLLFLSDYKLAFEDWGAGNMRMRCDQTDEACRMAEWRLRNTQHLERLQACAAGAHVPIQDELELLIASLRRAGAQQPSVCPFRT